MRYQHKPWKCKLQSSRRDLTFHIPTVRILKHHLIPRYSVPIVLAALLGILTFVNSSSAQAEFSGWSISGVLQGNFRTKNDYGVCNDFQVLKPIVISKLGMFDDGGDGIQGSDVVKIQLYEDSGKETLLLESLSFDAASPGELQNGFRYKSLPQAVTLFPGRYTLTANGFDSTNRAYDVTKEAFTAPRVILNDGGGAIRFLGSNRYFEKDNRLIRSKLERMIGPSDRIAAGSFIFYPARLAIGPHDSDYSALVNQVTSFPVVTDKTVFASYSYHYGSISLLTDSAFPVLVEPGGNRLVEEAAANYTGDVNGARCVAFAHEQWGHAFGDGRATLFENAIKWASRKTNPSEIVVGITSNLNASYFGGQGYQVRLVDTSTDLSICDCDVVVIDFNGEYSDQFMDGLSRFLGNKGGLVCTFLPWRFVHGGLQPLFGKVNAVLKPFGLTYRTSLTQPHDFGFANTQSGPYPNYFSALPAARLLYENRVGTTHLDSLARAICLNTINYAADGEPGLLAALTALYSTGTTNWTGGTKPPIAVMGTLMDIAVLAGSQAAFSSNWLISGNSIIARGLRGAVDYQFRVPAPDIYRIEVVGRQASKANVGDDFDLIMSVDGIDLGHHSFSANNDTNSVVGCWTPYLLPGLHNLRIFWDGVGEYNCLQIEAVHVEMAAGEDSNINGIKDWVEGWIDSQSGLDETNYNLTSYVTPYCIEGRDPYPSLMKITVAGADDSGGPSVRPHVAPNGRWYADIPLAKSGDTSIQIAYQNGAKSETRLLHRQVINVLDGGTFTIRKGDSLALTARPAVGWTNSGQMAFTVSTNQWLAKVQASYQFNDAGKYRLSGRYTSPIGVSDTGSITVNVIEHSFSNNPACWVGKERIYDVPSVLSNVVLESDLTLICVQTATLPDDGIRLSLLAGEPKQQFITSRLDEHGPILDSTHAESFQLYSSGQVYMKITETYSDGTQAIDMGLVMSPVVPAAKIQLRILRGGVVFEDGTIFKEINATDLDGMGFTNVRFLRSQDMQGSVCHELKVFQDNVLIGTR